MSIAVSAYSIPARQNKYYESEKVQKLNKIIAT